MLMECPQPAGFLLLRRQAWRCNQRTSMSLCFFGSSLASNYRSWWEKDHSLLRTPSSLVYIATAMTSSPQVLSCNRSLQHHIYQAPSSLHLVPAMPKLVLSWEEPLQLQERQSGTAFAFPSNASIALSWAFLQVAKTPCRKALPYSTISWLSGLWTRDRLCAPSCPDARRWSLKLMMTRSLIALVLSRSILQWSIGKGLCLRAEDCSDSQTSAKSFQSVRT